MIELTDEMRAKIGTALADGFPVIAASVDTDGQPKLSFYGSTHVRGPDQLGVWVRNPESGVLSRIVTNPRMTFMYRNPTERLTWQLYGRARVVDGPERDEIYEAIPEIEKMLDAERGGVGLVIDLDRVTGRGIDMRRD